MTQFLKFNILNPAAPSQSGVQLVNLDAIRKIDQGNGANPSVYTGSSVRILTDVDDFLSSADVYGRSNAVQATAVTSITIDANAGVIAGMSVYNLLGTVSYGVIVSVSTIGAVTTCAMGFAIGTALVDNEPLEFRALPSIVDGSDVITITAGTDAGATVASVAASSTVSNLRIAIVDAISANPSSTVIEVVPPIDNGPLLIQNQASTTAGATITTAGGIFGAVQVGDTVLGIAAQLKANVTAVNAGTLVLDSSVGVLDAAGNMAYDVISGSGKQLFWRGFTQS